MSWYLYVFHTPMAISNGNDPSFAKIGVSADPHARLKAIQCGCPLPLFIWRAYKMKDMKQAYKIEARTHGRLGDSMTSGEWCRTQTEQFQTAIFDLDFEFHRNHFLETDEIFQKEVSCL